MVWKSFRCIFKTPGGLPCAFYEGVASVWPLYHTGLIDGLLQRWLSFWKVLLSPQRNAGTLTEWPLDSWSPPWLRPFSPIAQFRRPASSRKSPGGSELLPFTDDGGHFAQWDLQSSRIFSVPFPIFVPQDNPVSEVYGQFLWLHAWFVLWHALSTVGPHINRCVPSQIIPNQLNLPQVDSN